MNTEKITFDKLPEVTLQLRDEVRELKNLVLALTNGSKLADDHVWMNLSELCEYLPDKPSKPTVYGWVCNWQIPFHKTSKRLSFLKSEIDVWIMDSSRTAADGLRQSALEEHDDRKGGLR